MELRASHQSWKLHRTATSGAQGKKRPPATRPKYTNTNTKEVKMTADEIQDAIFDWTERHKKGIGIATAITMLIALTLNGMLENGLI